MARPLFTFCLALLLPLFIALSVPPLWFRPQQGSNHSPAPLHRPPGRPQPGTACQHRAGPGPGQPFVHCVGSVFPSAPRQRDDGEFLLKPFSVFLFSKMHIPIKNYIYTLLRQNMASWCRNNGLCIYCLSIPGSRTATWTEPAGDAGVAAWTCKAGQTEGIETNPSDPWAAGHTNQVHQNMDRKIFKKDHE